MDLANHSARLPARFSLLVEVAGADDVVPELSWMPLLAWISTICPSSRSSWLMLSTILTAGCSASVR